MIAQYPKIEAVNPRACYSKKMMMCNKMIANIFRKHLKDFDITDSQLSILFFVTKSNSATQKQISDSLASEKSTVNRNIKRLIERQYLSSKNNSLVTTEIGKNTLEKIIPSWENAMNEVSDILGKDGEKALDIIQEKLSQHKC